MSPFTISGGTRTIRSWILALSMIAGLASLTLVAEMAVASECVPDGVNVSVSDAQCGHVDACLGSEAVVVGMGVHVNAWAIEETGASAGVGTEPCQPCSCGPNPLDNLHAID